MRCLLSPVTVRNRGRGRRREEGGGGGGRGEEGEGGGRKRESANMTRKYIFSLYIINKRNTDEIFCVHTN